MEKLNNDNWTDKLVKLGGEGIWQKEGNKIKIQRRMKERKSWE